MPCRARVIITASTSVRGKKSTPLKEIVDTSCQLASKAAHKVWCNLPPCTCTALGSCMPSSIVTHITHDHVRHMPSAHAQVDKVLVYEHPALRRDKTPWNSSRDVWWGDEVAKQKPQCPVVWLDSEAPLFLLYTSGSTGKPKGVQHSIGACELAVMPIAKHADPYRQASLVRLSVCLTMPQHMRLSVSSVACKSCT